MLHGRGNIRGNLSDVRGIVGEHVGSREQRHGSGDLDAVGIARRFLGAEAARRHARGIVARLLGAPVGERTEKVRGFRHGDG